MAAEDIIQPAILAGGSGTRLWPVSRDDMPKQFQPLTGPLSTYQQTLKRVRDPRLFSAPLVVTSEPFRFLARRQAEEVGVAARVVLEPVRRDLAAAVAVAAVMAERQRPGSLVLALAADHVVLDDELYIDAVRIGADAARVGRIVVFGLAPTEPRTSFGYVKLGAPLDGAADLHAIAEFVEKPDAETALRYVRDGYLWNSGNFLFRSDVLIEELRRFAPDILDPVEAAVEAASEDIGFVRVDPARFETARATSIDYAVIEKTDRAALVVGRFRWSDVGSWDAIWRVSARDDSGNAVNGAGILLDSRNCVVQSQDILTAVIGMDDAVVVATQDAVMVAPRARAQDVKRLVDALKARGRREAISHLQEFRPWGSFDCIDRGERFQVKRIVVNPGGVLSLQRHLHRAEHWVVVRGTAEVTIGDSVRSVHENESVYIPIGAVHRLANRGRIPLEVVEVQTGSYLGEDDIVRLDDEYDRS